MNNSYVNEPYVVVGGGCTTGVNIGNDHPEPILFVVSDIKERCVAHTCRVFVFKIRLNTVIIVKTTWVDEW